MKNICVSREGFEVGAMNKQNYKEVSTIGRWGRMHPQDVAHARIYDRVLEMCVPVSCFGTSIRKDTAQEKLNNLKSLIG